MEILPDGNAELQGAIKLAELGFAPTVAEEGYLEYNYTSSELRFWDGSQWEVLNGVAPIFEDANNFTIGNTNPPQIFSASANYQLGVVGDASGKAVLSASTYDDFPEVRLYRTNGSPGGELPIGEYEIMGEVAFGGADASGSYFPGATITSQATEDWGNSTNLGSQLSFNITPLGGASPETMMSIEDDGVFVSGQLGTSNYGDGAYLQFARANGSPGGELAVAAGEVIGDMNFVAWDGSDYQFGAGIRTEANLPWASASNTSTAMIFTVTPLGTTTPLEVMTLNGGGMSLQNDLQLTGGVRLGQYQGPLFEGALQWETTGDLLQVYDGTAWQTVNSGGGLTIATYEDSNNLTIGGVSPPNFVSGGEFQLGVVGDGAPSFLTAHAYGAVPQVGLTRANGSEGSALPTIGNDILGQVAFSGMYGSNQYPITAVIKAEANQTFADNNNLGTDLSLNVTASGTGVLKEVMRLTGNLVNIDASVQTSGNLTAGGVIVGAYVGDAGTAPNGALRYTGTQLEVRDAGAWQPVGGGGGFTVPETATDNLTQPLLTLQNDNNAHPAAEFNNADPNSNALRLGGNLSFKNSPGDRKISVIGAPNGTDANNLLISAGSNAPTTADRGGDVKISGGRGGDNPTGRGGDVILEPGLGNVDGKVFIQGNLRIDDGNAAVGYVLKALDAQGNATWQPESGGGAASILANNNHLFGPAAQATGLTGSDNILIGSRPGVLTTGGKNTLVGNEADVAGLGTQGATALGYGAEAKNNFSVALGGEAEANNNYAIAIGGDANADNTGASASGDFSISIGAESQTNAPKGIAVGNLANAMAPDAIALGSGARVNALANDGIAIGRGARVNNDGDRSIAIGANNGGAPEGAFADGQDHVVIGTDATANGNNAIALGRSADAGNVSVAIGNNAVAGATAVAIGTNANAGNNAVAIGSSTDAPNMNTIILGDGNLGSQYNVGIGTEDPQAKLEVVGDIKTRNLITTPAEPTLELDMPTPTTRIIRIRTDGTIRSIDPGVDGQEVIIISAAGSVVLEHGTQAGENLQLKLGGNAVLLMGSTIHLVFDGYSSKWLEINRSVNNP